MSSVESGRSSVSSVQFVDRSTIAPAAGGPTCLSSALAVRRRDQQSRVRSRGLHGAWQRISNGRRPNAIEGAADMPFRSGLRGANSSAMPSGLCSAGQTWWNGFGSVRQYVVHHAELVAVRVGHDDLASPTSDQVGGGLVTQPAYLERRVLSPRASRARRTNSPRSGQVPSIVLLRITMSAFQTERWEKMPLAPSLSPSLW